MSRSLRPHLGALLLTVLWIAGAPGVWAAPAVLPVASDDGVLLKTDEALALAFGKHEVTSERTYLKPSQKKRIARLCGAEYDRGIVNAYVARDAKGKRVGTAYFDRHKVRTKHETLMVVIDEKGKITRVEVLQFGEPKRYLPKARWFAQLVGKGIDDDLSLKGDIKNLSGSTLSARAAVDAARRVLAQHQVLAEIAREAQRKKTPTEKPRPDGPPPTEGPDPKPKPEDGGGGGQ